MCIYCVYEHTELQKTKEGIRSLGAGVTGICESPDTDACNQTSLQVKQMLLRIHSKVVGIYIYKVNAQ